MKLIVLSSPDKVSNEINYVVDMFQNGLEHFHIRKPKFSKREMIEYIESFPELYRKQLILHAYHSLAFKYKLGGIHLSSRHRKRGKSYSIQLYFQRLLYPGLIVTRSFHKLNDLAVDKRKYSYAFLSPVFDSISYSTLSANFSKRALLIMMGQYKWDIIALGGVKPEYMQTIKDLGFAGAAMLGAVWKDEKDPLTVFMEAKEAAIKAVKNAMQDPLKS